MTKFKFGPKTLILCTMICMQVFAAAISGLLPFIINGKFGSSHLADILYQYSLFVLAYSVVSFGIPEQIQVMRSVGGGGERLHKGLIYANIIVGISSAACLFMPNIGPSLPMFVFCLNYLLVESNSRIVNQEGRVLIGAMILLSLPVSFWLSAYYLKTDPGINLVFISGVLGVMSGLYSISLLASSDRKLLSESASFSRNGAIKTYINRISSAVLDNGPIVVLYAVVDNSSVVVMYAFISRVIMPISLVMQSLLAVNLRDKLSNNHYGPVLGLGQKYCLLLLASCIITASYWFLPEEVLAVLDIPKIALSVVFSMCIYRLSVLAFNLQNSWNIGNLRHLSWLQASSPIFFFSIIFGFYRYIMPNALVLFGVLSTIVISYEIYFGLKYSLEKKLV
jgi:hypothetical protein